MGQAYYIPKRKLCEHCGEILTYERMFLYIFDTQPFIFCVPTEKKRCFYEWYQMMRTPNTLRLKGLL